MIPKKDYVEEFEALDNRYGVGSIVLDRLKRSVGDRKILVCTIGYTGTKHFDSAVRERFDRCGINYEARLLPEIDKKGGGNYRPFVADPEGFRSDAEILMLFDGIIEDGGTMVGANVWALKNLRSIGPKKVLSVAIKDNKGIANYSFVPTFFIDTSYVCPARGIELLAPPDDIVAVRDSFEHLSTENPYDHTLFGWLGESWREDRVNIEESARVDLSAASSTRIVPQSEVRYTEHPMGGQKTASNRTLRIEVATPSMIDLEEKYRDSLKIRIGLFLRRITDRAFGL